MILILVTFMCTTVLWLWLFLDALPEIREEAVNTSDMQTYVEIKANGMVILSGSVAELKAINSIHGKNTQKISVDVGRVEL